MMRTLLVSAILGITIAGCGGVPQPFQAYAGPPQPELDVAIVHFHYNGFMKVQKRALSTVSVDGVDLGKPVTFGDLRNLLIAVTPGSHQLGLALHEFESLSVSQITSRVHRVTLDVQLRPGYRYAVCPQTDGSRQAFLKEIGPTASFASMPLEAQQAVQLEPCNR